ncbi:MAG TPA: TonB-dependent siderophore receptor, partial [Modicisalibacter sp.]|nr:TonB-dependent siderophore receptor [Modicisalibacter sp.]
NLEAFTVDNQLQADFTTGAAEHTLLFGLDYQHRKTDVDWFLGSFPQIDAFDPEYGAEGTIFPYSQRTRRLEQTGVYLQDQLAIGNWRLTLGGRNDWVDISNDIEDAGLPARTVEGNHEKFSGRAGLLYLFDNGFAPYLSYSESFSPSSNVDSDNNLLEPTEGIQYEAGLKFQPPGSASRYTVSLFHIEQENVANFIQDENGGFYEPVGEIRSRGVEIEAQTQVTDNLLLLGSYTYTDITYQEAEDGTQGNTVNMVPRHLASLWSNYSFSSGALNGLDIGLGVRYIGESWADKENTRKVSSYTLVDASLRYDLGMLGLNGVEARLNANNLLDKEYVAACYSLARCYFGAERSVVGTLSYTF